MDSNKQNFLFKFGEIKCSDTGTPQKGVEKVENPETSKPLVLPESMGAGQPNVTAAVDSIGETMKTMQESAHRGPDCLPLSEGHRTDINIVQDFPWTKTSIRSPILQHTPTITLEELTVSSPAFFNNVILIADQFIKKGPTAPGEAFNKDFTPTGVGRVLSEITKQLEESAKGTDPDTGETIDTWLGVPKYLRKGTQNALKGISFVRDMATALKQVGYGVSPISNAAAHLKNYEPMYGIRPTNFMYRLPYMGDSIKEISNSWSTDSSIVGGHLDLMKKITSLVSPGVGIDLSKTFDFPDSGPSYEITFYLDNQGPESKSTLYYNDWERNFRFIYLLLYQNLPNKLTRTAVTPPVIYRANLPGVFSFYWSFLSNIAIKFIGNRRTTALKVGATDPFPSEVVIPEGYEIKLTLTSLTPETRNLMYNALGGHVTSRVELPSLADEGMSPITDPTKNATPVRRTTPSRRTPKP